MTLSNTQAVAAMESMALAETVDSILKIKGNHVWSIDPEAMVYEAIAQMAERHVGALMVVSNGRLEGIVSERDYARKVILQGHSSKDTKVRQIMTTDVATVTPGHTVAQCMRVITDRRIRHLPVVDGESLAGVISIGDLVYKIISAQTDTIRHLSSYITGEYPA
jgi:CBS domain-containing protein